MIVACGEALVDLIPERHGEAELFAPRLGGSPYNVAIGLGRLESRVGFLGRLSSDFFGELLRARLVANGVDGRYLRDGPELSALAFVHLEGAGEPRYVFYGENTADRNLGPEDLPDAFAEEVEALHFGSISLVLEPTATALETCMRREQGRRLISLDPNIRPLLIPDWHAYRKRLDGWLELADLVKASRADLSWLYPGEPAERIAQRWLGRGPRLVVVTQGKDGCVGFTPTQSLQVPNATVQIIDTIGAGDAFTSCLLSQLDQRGLLDPAALAALSSVELREVLAYANLAGALACTRPGAEPPYRAELEEWLSRLPPT